MPFLLNIDTATEHASVCISKGKEVLAMQQSTDQKNHASFIQPAIQQLLESCNLKPESIHAVAVAAGPGSYTGLRVGLATAKGLCYALKKSLILINTLEVIALASVQEAGNLQHTTTNNKPETINPVLFCPMIDARRMEVFTALYNDLLQPQMQPSAMLLDEHSFETYLEKNQIIFSGSGHHKMQKILHHPNAIFSSVTHHAGHLAFLAANAYANAQFADVAYSEPLYLKEFFTYARH